VTLDIYLDDNATTPVAPEVRDAMLPFLAGAFGRAMATVESAKWGGSVRAAFPAVNEAMVARAAPINADPCGAGWMLLLVPDAPLGRRPRHRPGDRPGLRGPDGAGGLRGLPPARLMAEARTSHCNKAVERLGLL
jgi:hypothetical protein